MNSVPETTDTLPRAARRRTALISLSERLGSITQEQVVLLFAFAIVVVFAIALPGFAIWGNFIALLRSISILGIFALGMAVVIIGRGIDLSQIAIALVSAGTATALMIAGIDLRVALVAGLICAIGLGLTNGMLVAFLNFPPLFATLATALVMVGVARSTLLTSMFLSVPAELSSFLMLGQNLRGIPIPLIVFAVSAALLHVFLSWTIFGRFIYAYGDNGEAARLSGMPVRLLTLIEYSLSAAISYVAGILMVASTAMLNLRVVSSTMIFDVILIAVLGGVGLVGGRGGVHSVLAGVILIGVLLNGMTIMDLDYQLQNIIKGAVLLIAIAIDTVLHPHDIETARQGA
jgi:ribose transport system permease protein